jgi:nucleotide-binding universal stress UspA family protein
MDTILFATDGSPSARAAQAEALTLAKATGWRLRVVTVWRIPILTGYGFAPTPYVPELADAEREHAENVAQAAVEAAKAAGVEATWELRQGDASDEICAAAKETAARLIVMGAHGWGTFQRVVFGSVSTAVLHHAPSPVLIVRGPDEEKDVDEPAATPVETAVR